MVCGDVAVVLGGDNSAEDVHGCLEVGDGVVVLLHFHAGHADVVEAGRHGGVLASVVDSADVEGLGVVPKGFAGFL